VLVQLAGGNDGLNTLIPFEDADYYRLRPTLSIPKDRVLRISDTHGFHPSMTSLQRLLHDGKLAVVQNVGYPNPNRSHFRSTEIWETGSDADEVLATGWIGRYLDNACAGAPADVHDPAAVHLTESVPQSFSAAASHPTFGLPPNARTRAENEQARQLLEKLSVLPDAHDHGNSAFLQQTFMDTLITETKVHGILSGYQAEATYPTNPFATSLRNVAALIASGLPTRVYFVSLTGFDTHSNQLGTQANLLTELSEGLAAFQADLEKHKLDNQVVTMTFSEFGRRPSENNSRGTDHGTAAPLFVMGSRIKAGLHGSAPSLKLERNQDLTFSTDFRQVYATVLERWLNCPSKPILGHQFAPIGVL